MHLELKLKALSMSTNRTVNKLKQLLILCDNDFNKLLLLEQKIKDNYYFLMSYTYCPETINQVNDILNTKYPTNTENSSKVDIYKKYIINLLRITF